MQCRVVADPRLNHWWAESSAVIYWHAFKGKSKGNVGQEAYFIQNKLQVTEYLLTMKLVAALQVSTSPWGRA